jgi:hypothetical protein
MQPLYAVPIQHACESRDLKQMKELAARAEEHWQRMVISLPSWPS